MLSNPTDPNSTDEAACTANPAINDVEFYHTGAGPGEAIPQSSGESFHLNVLGQTAMANGVKNYLGLNPVSPLADPTITQGQTISTPVTVTAGASELSVSVNWESGTLSTDLVSPSGQIIDASTSDSDVSEQGDSTWQSYLVSNPEAGTWTVETTGTSVQSGGEDVTINASSVPALALPPTAVASASSTTGTAPLTVSFSGAGSTASDGGSLSYAWDFGDGTTATGETVAHTYTTDGVFTPWLTVTDDTGAVASAATDSIVIGPQGNLSAPLSFDPVQVGQQTPVQMETLTSVGSAPLVVTGLTPASDGLGDPGSGADVEIVQDQCSGTTLVPGSSCTFGVVMVPQAAGSRSAAIVVDDDSVSPDYTFVTGAGIAATATTLASSADPAVTGQAVTYTATVTSTSGGINPSGEGTVMFSAGGASLCGGPVALSGNQASCTLSYMVAGASQVTAGYSGGPDFDASTSPATTETVSPDATATTLALSSSSVLFGQALTLTATVMASAPGTGIPTGTVTFLEGNTVLGTGSLSSAGEATLSTNAVLPASQSTVRATYSGDPNYLTSTSAASGVSVTFTSCISGSHSGSLTVAAGQSVCITGTVSGSVTVQAGGALEISGGKVSGSVTMTQPTAAMVCAASISGPLSISGAAGPVVVGAVSGCTGSTISGAITLSGGSAGIELDGNTVSGGVTVTNPTSALLCANTVSGALSVKGATGLVTVGDPPGCSGNHVSGAVTLSQDAGGVQLGGNTITGSVSVTSNGTTSSPGPSAPAVDANKITGALSCSGNTPAPVDGGLANTVTGARSGQCGAAGF
jgi:PKD repeat protein